MSNNKGKFRMVRQPVTRDCSMSGERRNRFRVRYARVVLMETTVEARSADEVRDEGLPGVFHGIPLEMMGRHIKDVQDYEHVWEIAPAQ